MKVAKSGTFVDGVAIRVRIDFVFANGEIMFETSAIGANGAEIASGKSRNSTAEALGYTIANALSGGAESLDGDVERALAVAILSSFRETVGAVMGGS